MSKPNVGVMRQVDPVPGKQLTRIMRDNLAAATGNREQAPALRPPRREQEPTMRKQTGRRYGPAPRKESTGTARPMSDNRRASIYGLRVVDTLIDDLGNHGSRLHGGTARQRRQWTRMHRRNS